MTNDPQGHTGFFNANGESTRCLTLLLGEGKVLRSLPRKFVRINIFRCILQPFEMTSTSLRLTFPNEPYVQPFKQEKGFHIAGDKTVFI